MHLIVRVIERSPVATCAKILIHSRRTNSLQQDQQEDERKNLDLNFAPSKFIWTFEANELSLREMWSPGVAAEQTNGHLAGCPKSK